VEECQCVLRAGWEDVFDWVSELLYVPDAAGAGHPTPTRSYLGEEVDVDPP
jgi:hypothetical protein